MRQLRMRKRQSKQSEIGSSATDQRQDILKNLQSAKLALVIIRFVVVSDSSILFETDEVFSASS